MFALLGGLRARLAWPSLAMKLQPGAQGAAAAARRPSGRRRPGRVPFTARAVRHGSTHQVLPSTLDRSGAQWTSAR